MDPLNLWPKPVVPHPQLFGRANHRTMERHKNLSPRIPNDRHPSTVVNSKTRAASSQGAISYLHPYYTRMGGNVCGRNIYVARVASVGGLFFECTCHLRPQFLQAARIALVCYVGYQVWGN